MTDFLDRVVRERRADVAAAKAWRSLERMRNSSWRARRSLRRFGESLRDRRAAGHLAVIAEVKRVSPALGPLAPIDDPGALARIYIDAGAAAVSVLVEPRHWGGSLEDLQAVRSAVGDRVPILAKDVVVDEYQIAAARAAGADAVLLIAEALDDRLLADLIAAANELGMDALVEAHDHDAFARAIRCTTPRFRRVRVASSPAVDTVLTFDEARAEQVAERTPGEVVLGVNARDLREPQRIDHRRVHDLARVTLPGPVLVAESGITSVADAESLPPRVDAILVGTALVRSADPAALLRAMSAARPGRALA